MSGMSGMPARVSVVTLGARDLPALREFYRGLGWVEHEGSNDGWAAFMVGGVLLALYPMAALAAEAAPGRAAVSGDATPGDDALAWNGMTLACNVDGREQVDVVWRAAVAAGATAVGQPTDREWGGRSGYVADPEGNRWEIAWAANATFDQRGAMTGFGS